MFNCVFATFPCGTLGQVWYLIVSIPDLCQLSYFDPKFVNSRKTGGVNIFKDFPDAGMVHEHGNLLHIFLKHTLNVYGQLLSTSHLLPCMCASQGSKGKQKYFQGWPKTVFLNPNCAQNDHNYNAFLKSAAFCCSLITFANSLDQNQDRHFVDPDLDPYRLTL